MIIKLIVASATVLVILVSIIVILNVDFEQHKDNFNNDNDKFTGKWRLISTESDIPEDDVSDTTEEPDNIVNYETFEFLSNGTYYHVIDENNYSGSWEINNSILVLTKDELFEVFSYNYVFSDNNFRVTLSTIEDPTNMLEFEKIII